MSRQARWTLGVVVALAVTALFSCQAILRTATKISPQRYAPQGDPKDLTATFLGADQQRAHVGVKLTRIASGFEQPTTLAFVPGEPQTAKLFQLLESLEMKSSLAEARTRYSGQAELF